MRKARASGYLPGILLLLFTVITGLDWTLLFCPTSTVAHSFLPPHPSSSPTPWYSMEKKVIAKHGDASDKENGAVTRWSRKKAAHTNVFFS
ncbi:hypothetical protein E2C01_020989 [Portunus trituberculatus]|uniref:Uncharacterized protein n=1 Tax=Portunus trituberculatus TaxID=210409 RepID=A0A5B7E382_PORTR|nr:hypothetical protein [Portunus trituberculatus]